MRLRATLGLLLVTASPLLAAEATTYKGTIGKTPIILEMAGGNESGDFVARYAYLSKGGDIPLHGKAKDDGTYAIEEEAPCSKEICRDAKDELITKAPIGARWTLASVDDDETLTGTWTDAKSGKHLPLAFKRVGSRELPEGVDSASPDSLDPSSATTSDDPQLTPDELPYDFLKLAAPLPKGPETRVGKLAWRLDLDKRVGLAYPVVTELDGVDIGLVNAFLKQQRLQFALPAFYCMSQAYLGFNWSGVGGEGTTGYEEDGAGASLDYLSPRLISVVENGSYYCGGAYPDHFINRHFADTKTGEVLVPERLLKGWVARNADGAVVDPSTVDASDLTFGPSDELVKYVNDHRDKTDTSREAECGLADLVASNLGVFFTRDELVFTLTSLPHAIFACGDDLVRVPLRDARPLLTESGAKYFEILDR